MSVFNTKKIIFWGINLLVAVSLLFLIGYVVLQRLDSYTLHGQYISVPDLRGLTPSEAAPFLQEKNLFAVVIDSIYDDHAKAGTVVEQFPSPESKVKNSRTIQLTINANAPEKLIFPNLKNTAFRQTIQKLKNIGFNIGRLKYTSSNFKNLVLGFMYKEEPIEPGDIIQKGESIDIILGDGNTSNNQIFIPNLRGKTLEEAKSLILFSFLNLGEVITDETIRTPQDRLEAFIYKQMPDIEEHPKITLGSYLTVYLTKDQEKLAVQDSLSIETQEE